MKNCDNFNTVHSKKLLLKRTRRQRFFCGLPASSGTDADRGNICDDDVNPALLSGGGGDSAAQLSVGDGANSVSAYAQTVTTATTS